MNCLYQQLVNRRKYLMQLQEEIAWQLKDLPQGRLRVNNDREVEFSYYALGVPKSETSYREGDSTRVEYVYEF